MLYYPVDPRGQHWTICETLPDPERLGRIESLFHLANGFMEVRCATEERHLGEQRGHFVAGTFNRFSPADVSELPNLPDLLNLEIRLDGERLVPAPENTNDYRLTLDMSSGLVTRVFEYTTRSGSTLKVRFDRIVSMDRKHILA